MRIHTLSNILLIGSLILLFPLASNSESVQLIQNTPKSIAFEIHQPDIKIISEIPGNVLVNVTHIYPAENKTTVVEINAELSLSIRELSFDAEKSGFYIFDFLSTNAGIVIIEGQGIYQNTVILIVLTSLFRFALIVKNRFF